MFGFKFDKERRAYGSMPRLEQFPVLMEYKARYPEEFRLLTRCIPSTFDMLVARIADTTPYAMRRGMSGGFRSCRKPRSGARPMSSGTVASVGMRVSSIAEKTRAPS